MNKTLIDLIQEKGFKCHRKNYDKLTGEFSYEPTEFTNTYSTMVNGFLDYRFIYKQYEIQFGIREREKPPTLLYPCKFIPNYNSNDSRVRFLQDHTAQEVYDLIIKEFLKTKFKLRIWKNLYLIYTIVDGTVLRDDVREFSFKSLDSNGLWENRFHLFSSKFKVTIWYTGNIGKKRKWKI